MVLTKSRSTEIGDPMRRIRYFLITIALLALVPSQATAANDPLDIVIATEIGHDYGKMAADAINSAAEYRNSIADFNRNIAAARAEFWRQYPNGPDIQTARKKFSALLLGKDILLMNQTALSGKFTNGSRAQPNAMDLLSAIGGKIDSGVRPMAGRQFYTWVGLIRKRLGAHGSMDIFEFPGRYATAIGDAWPAYKLYEFTRDCAEFMAAGKFPPGVNGPGSYIELLMVQELTRSIDWGDLSPSPDVDRLAEARAEAHDTYKRLTQIFGEGKVRSVATKVMKAEVSQDGDLKDPASLGIVGWRLDLEPSADIPAPSGLIPYYRTDPYGAFFAILTNLGPREYLLGLVAQHVSPLCTGCTLGKIIAQTTGPEIQRLELAYGSESLEGAAEVVRHSPKRLYDGDLLKSKWGGNPYGAFMRIVSYKNPSGFVRWLILTDVPNISSKDTLDAAYQKLAARYPEPKILKAAHGLIDPQTLPWGLQSIAYDPTSFGSLTALVGVLRGMDDPALMGLKEPERKKDPTYLTWACFAPGTTITVRSFSFARQKPYTRKIPNGPDMQVRGWEKVTDQTVPTTNRLVSVDDEKIVLNYTEPRVGSPPRSVDTAYYVTMPPGTEYTYPFGAKVRFGREPVKKIESGSETLVIAGKSLPTRWWAVTREVTNFNKKEDRTDKAWFSDQVPGGIVKLINDHGTIGKVSSFSGWEVISFQGEPRPNVQNGLFSLLSSSFGTDDR